MVLLSSLLKETDTSCSMGAFSKPEAESTPGFLGTRTLVICSSSAKAQAWSGPAPPNAINENSLGSNPCFTDTERIPSDI